MGSQKKVYIAFTLVEMLMVIVVVAVIAAIAVPRMQGNTLRSRETSLRANLKLIREAADRAEVDTGLTFPVPALASATPPSTGWERGAMNSNWTVKSVPAGSWRGPYLHRVPINPMTGRNDYIGGQAVSTGSWTHASMQNVTRHYLFYPSAAISSEGTPYNTW